jgi:hypothetical protein
MIRVVGLANIFAIVTFPSGCAEVESAKANRSAVATHIRRSR